MTTPNESNSILENLDSRVVAQALFPEPITASNEIKEVVKTRGKKSKNEPVANAYKNATVQIMNDLLYIYKIECTVRYGSASWMSKTQRNHGIKIFCKKCFEIKLASNKEPGKEDLVALAVCNDERKKEPSVTVKRVFFHDSHHVETKDDASRHPRNGWETVKFPIETIFRETYKSSIEQIGSYAVGGGKLPPGDRVKFGEDDSGNKGQTVKTTKFYDNRVYCKLPDESKYPSITGEEHRQCMIRLMFFLAAEYNIAKEMAPFTAPDNMFMPTLAGDHEIKDVKNSDKHLSLANASLIFGGHQLDKADKPLLYQPLHQDFSYSNKKKEPKALSVKFKPASFLIPLETSRFVHLQTHGNLVEVRRGEILFYSGDLLYADHALPSTRKDWNVAVHGHIDSSIWNRFVVNGAKMHWDHDLVQSNARCLSKCGSVGDILKGMEANIQVATCLFEAAEEKLKDLGIKTGKKRSLAEVNARSEKVLRELRDVTESLKAITAELG